MAPRLMKVRAVFCLKQLQLLLRLLVSSSGKDSKASWEFLTTRGSVGLSLKQGTRKKEPQLIGTASWGRRLQGLLTGTRCKSICTRMAAATRSADLARRLLLLSSPSIARPASSRTLELPLRCSGHRRSSRKESRFRSFQLDGRCARLFASCRFSNRGTC